MSRFAKILLVGALAVAMFGVGGLGLLRAGRTEAPPPSLAPGAAAALQSGPLLASGSLSQIIEALQARVRAVPQDWRALADLGLAYVQQARVTADPTYYPKAEGVLRKSLAQHPDENFNAMTGMAALAAARHDFAAALSWGEQASGINPHNANARAVIGDALVELGRYQEAFEAYQKAIDLRPDVATYARGSYALELQGDVKGAIRIMTLALQAAGTPSDRAWASYQVAELHWNSGAIDEAERLYREASRHDPTYMPARAGRAKVETARGRTERAIRDMQAVVNAYPTPEYVVWLGDLLKVAGRDEEAAQQFALVDVEAQLLRANGVNVDLEIALFDADHGRPQEALAAAQAERARRQGIHVEDALGWALYASGRYREALSSADAALALGTRNALFHFHRGMIHRALGHESAARRDLAAALDINPNFSILWSKVAATALRSLGGGP